MKEILQLSNFSAGYHGKPVVHNINLNVCEGEIIGLLGPNGAGKTTLFRSITGLCAPITGGGSLFGYDIKNIKSHERAKLAAVIPQELEISVPFTVQEIVAIGRTASISRWTSLTKHDKSIIERAMAYTDLTDMKHRPFTELSGGEKQRAIVAMALAQQPRIILMDEATSHLDINHRLEIMRIIERLNTEDHVTVLMISHDINLTAEFSNRLLLMDKGKIISDGPAAKVLTEEILRRVYHCHVEVRRNTSNSSVTVVPAHRLTKGVSGAGIHIHVICGGGCGEETIRRLCLCDYTITCGVLNQQDSDAEIAEALGIKTILEKPFSPISKTAFESAKQMISAADAVVVCGIPFGTGNVINLDLAEYAMSLGTKVFIMDKTSERDYTPRKEATGKACKLIEQGAETWSDILELLSILPSK